MKTVTVTLKFEFETEEVDDSTLKEALIEAFEERADNDELLERAKIKIVDQEPDEEDDEPDFEDEDED